jgi:MYXO-CTERM domain-containing protein
LVIDTDPPNGILDRDIDEIETFDTLYAAWEGTAGTIYEVSIVTSDLAPVTDGFVWVGAGTEATLGGLDLRVGVRYIVAVRAREGDEVSPESVSDGVVVVDRAAPIIEITAVPDWIRQGTGDESLLSVYATDRRGLDHVSVEIRTADGSTVEVLLDEEVSGAEYDWSAGWDARDPSGAALPTGSYSAFARAIGEGGAETTAWVWIEVRERSSGSGAWMARGDGCSCRSASAGSAGTGLALGALWVGSLLRRRRRVQA